jgi:hypothetical protein
MGTTATATAKAKAGKRDRIKDLTARRTGQPKGGKDAPVHADDLLIGVGAPRWRPAVAGCHWLSRGQHAVVALTSL